MIAEDCQLVNQLRETLNTQGIQSLLNLRSYNYIQLFSQGQWQEKDADKKELNILFRYLTTSTKKLHYKY